MTRTIRTYSQITLIPTFEERFEYLKIQGAIGEPTFGNLRWINQEFYRSEEWRQARNKVIIRDSCADGVLDLGIPGRLIFGKVYVHHMVPLTEEDIYLASDFLLNPEYLICTSEITHKAIHYGGFATVPPPIVMDRKPFDTCSWKVTN